MRRIGHAPGVLHPNVWCVRARCVGSAPQWPTIGGTSRTPHVQQGSETQRLECRQGILSARARRLQTQPEQTIPACERESSWSFDTKFASFTWFALHCAVL